MAIVVDKKAITFVHSVPLSALARTIERHHQEFRMNARATLNSAMACGDLLVQAKGQVAHGEWLHWLQTNTSISERQAQTYMRLNEGREIVEAKYESDSDLTLRAAVALLAKPKPEAKPKPKIAKTNGAQQPEHEKIEVNDPGDSEQDIWRRGFMYRAEESKENAKFEDWSGFEVDDEVVKAANDALIAWAHVAEYLAKLRKEQSA